MVPFSLRNWDLDENSFLSCETKVDPAVAFVGLVGVAYPDVARGFLQLDVARGQAFCHYETRYTVIQLPLAHKNQSQNQDRLVAVVIEECVRNEAGIDINLLNVVNFQNRQEQPDTKRNMPRYT